MLVLLLDGQAGWTGSLPTWILVALAIIAGWRITKGGGGSAVSELSAANKILEDARQKNHAKIEEMAKQITALESKTDVVLAVSPLIADHERRAEERHQALVHTIEANTTVLEGLSRRISTDTEPA